MADKSEKSNKLKARLPRGLGDRTPGEIAATRLMIEKIRTVYELYGFEPVETPAIEYTDALGQFLPDEDRPNEGVFSFLDDDEQWLSLRYDLTAPLARYVAENFDTLPKPYRSYRVGQVFRNEKPGPGRFRQFMQFDADTVGSASPAADAELCMMAADTMEALGVPRGSYVVKLNSRKLLDGAMDSIGLREESDHAQRLAIIRALDKFDRLGEHGVRALLGRGRKDETGDFTTGAGLDEHQIDRMMMPFELNPQFADNFDNLPSWEQKDSSFVDVQLDPRTGRLVRQIYSQFAPGRIPINNKATLSLLRGWFGESKKIDEALAELTEIADLAHAAQYGTGRILIDPSIVRGLEYYTGPVFEVDLTFPIAGDDGKPIRFGSVSAGGRYDGLISRFRGQPVPATGFSIGVSRLLAALQNLDSTKTNRALGPVIVTIFDRDRMHDYQRMVVALRNAGIRAELYLGNPRNFSNQLKYADQRNAPCVIIQGSDEKIRGIVQIKDLVQGTEAALFHDAAGTSRERYLEQRVAQYPVREDQLVEAVSAILDRHTKLNTR